MSRIAQVSVVAVAADDDGEVTVTLKGEHLAATFGNLVGRRVVVVVEDQP